MDVKRVIEDIQHAQGMLHLSKQDLIETVVSIFYAGDTGDMRAFAEAFTNWDPRHAKGNLDFLCRAAEVYIESGKDMVQTMIDASFPEEKALPGRVMKFYTEAMNPPSHKPEQTQVPDKF